MAEETPVIAQYNRIKSEHPNEVLFFRLGDFYEMFNEDAAEVSRLLNLTLTHRGDNPMCGIPYHASKVYIARLLRMGKKIAIAEQIGEIAKKGLTERKVVEVITPGTATESEYLDGGANNFLACAAVTGNRGALAYIDVTTGEFRATSFSQGSMHENFSKELGRANPRELILPESLRNDSKFNIILEAYPALTVSYYPDWHFNPDLCHDRLVRQFGTVNLSPFGLEKTSAEVPPAGFLLDYIEKTTNTLSPHVTGIEIYSDSQYVIMDDSSRRNLEITSNLRDGSIQYTLLECVNCTETAMGSRMVRDWLSFPLTNEAAIRSRQNHVELFFSDHGLLSNVRNHLEGILDIERLAGRIAMDRAHAKDLVALKNSLVMWNRTRELLQDASFSFMESDTSANIVSLIENSITDDPATVFTEGRIIREGWSQELDHWKKIRSDFNSVLEEYIEEERQKTGIQNLKIKNTGNLGYFIEVTRGKLDLVPPHFIMKRTLVNADRYTTERLQELEASLNESGTRIIQLEHDLFLEVRGKLKEFVAYLRQVSREIAYIDVTASFAQSAVKHNWVRPDVSGTSIVFDVRNGRHPVVENHLPKGEFVPNDLQLCLDECQSAGAGSSRHGSHTADNFAGSSGDNFAGHFAGHFALITGPNMAGKSTFLRQNALICLLAQTGSFVPADSARLGIADRIFCRVGASDNLAKGESTFLVEMSETARILRSATERSLVIMDEVGRGTSTEDGLSIAWAVSEHLLNTVRCKTLFATHYHELTRLEHPGLKMLCMAVSESGTDVVFLRKVLEGASENSYGIHVARLAGIPSTVIDRASEILEQIQAKAGEKTRVAVTEKQSRQKKSQTKSLFGEEELVLNSILSVDTNNITPIQALQMICDWKKDLSGQ